MTEKLPADLHVNLEQAVGRMAWARRLFTGRLTSFLSPTNFWAWVGQRSDNRLIGGVSIYRPGGYVLRQPNMRGLGPKLFDPQYYYFRPADLPKPDVNQVTRFLAGLVARSPDTAFKSDVAIVISIATSKLASPIDDTCSLHDHAQAICDMADVDMRLFQAALLGDLATGRQLTLAEENASIRPFLIRTFARQRLIWAAADVQRVAAYAASAAGYHVAPYLKPFLKTGTASEYIRAMLKMPELAVRLKSAEVRAQTYGRDTIHVSGPKGPLLTILSAPARLIVNRLKKDDADAVLMTRGYVHDTTLAMADEIKAEMLGDADNQQSIFHFMHAGLSEISALFIAAYRFAEDEANMVKVIEDPSFHDLLWNAAHNPYPKFIDTSLAARARRLVAAYRPAILRDFHASKYEADRIDLAEDSEQAAWEFMINMAPKVNVSAHAYVQT